MTFLLKIPPKINLSMTIVMLVFAVYTNVMNLLLDKAILLTVCLAFYVPNMSAGGYVVVPVIIAISASALGSYFEHLAARAALFALYTGLCFFDSRFLFFLPLICFDLFYQRWQGIVLLLLVPLVYHVPDIGLYLAVQIVLLVLLAWLLKNRAISLHKLQAESTALRDANQETALLLELKNRELLERQDYEINLAMLKERNRIAREIHDNVGHQLTRAILFTGAMSASCQDDAVRNDLKALQSTLSESMDSIRTSLHDLHDQSVDLNTQIQEIIKDFSFCPVRFVYDIENPPDKKCKYAFLAIIREALSNVVRHSQATQTEIILREHPGFYQLIIRDNGLGAPQSSLENDSGIGLKSIAERVTSLGGLLNISSDKGFVIFITVPRAQRMEIAR